MGLGVSYYWYFYNQESKANIHELLPETSLLTIHGDGLSDDLEVFTTFEWSETLMTSPFLNNLNVWTSRFDSLNRSGELRSDIGSLPYWISFHSTADDAISPLFIIKSSGFNWNRKSIITLLNSVTGEQFDSQNQEFNGFELLNLKSSSTELVVLIQGKFLVFSEMNLLVEDVVRAIENEKSRLIKSETNANRTRDLQLILNNKRLKELNDIFFKNPILPNSNFGEVAILDLDFNDRGIQVSGRSYESGLKPIGSDLIAKNLIPNSSTSFQWLGFEVGLDNFEELIESDLLKVSLDMNFNDVSSVLVLNAVDTASLHSELKNIANDNLGELDSAAYSENYLNTELGYIQNDDFIKNITSGQVRMSSPYYAVFQNSLIFSSDLEALKTVMDDYDAEDTWGRSVDRRRVLDDLVQETDLTIVNEFQYANESMIDNLKPKWYDFFEDNPQFKSILNRLIIQLNSSNQGYLIASNLSFNLGNSFSTSTPDLVQEGLNIKANVFASEKLITKPYVVRNHNNSELVTIFQDAARDLYLTSRQGEVLWRKKLEGEIQGSIHQVDYYNNKKLQYLFFTDSLIHIIDRNGDLVDGFPKVYSSNIDLEGTRVVDYDNSKRYRYLTTDKRGNISLYSKEGSILEGWDPLAMNSELIHTPFHTRVRGRDVFVIVSKTGSISLVNRRGEFYSGFPVEQDLRLKGDVSLIKGPNFESTKLAVIDREGKLIEVNFEGEIVTDIQIFRPNLNSEFSLVNDVLETGYKVMRNDGRRITFFDMEGAEQFSFDYTNSGKVISEYYNFRNNKEIYVLRDTDRQELIILNGKGVAISPPIPASAKPSILYYQSTSQYEVFVNFTNQMNIYAIDAQ